MSDDVPVLDFKRLFESAPGLSLVLLPDQPRFTIVAVSDQYLKAAGKQRSDLLGRGLFEAFAGAPESPGNPLAAGVQNVRDSLLRALSSRAPDSLAPAPAVVRPGSFITTAVHGNDGQIVSLIHTLAGGVPDPWDGEENHRLIVELEESKAMLESRVKERTEDLLRSNHELEQFAYIASHDLQTPLRHISSYVQLLTTKIRKTVVLDAKSEKWIAYILSGTLQMKSLISDLLAYSRVGRVDIAVEEIDTSSLIVKVLDELREPLNSSNSKVVYGDLPQISGIRSQIDQLFQNLIENAFKFRRPETDPLVNITCESQGEFWRFSVADNGIGIDPKYSERIFLMFHRLHSNSEYPGTGIGLAICKKIVEFHGGKIELDTAADGGATFHFTLPKRQRIHVDGP